MIRGTVLNFISDLKGAILGGEFYFGILKRPMKKGWAFFLILATIMAIPIALNWGIMIFGFFNEGIEFFNRDIKRVEFSNGQIVNMPLSHKELQFHGWSIFIDTLYTDLESIQADLELARLPALFIGPKQAIIFAKPAVEPRLLAYPVSFSEVIDSEYLENLKTSAGFIIFIACLIASFAYKTLSGLLYMAVIIAPMVLFKFRRIGIGYGVAFKTALYLVAIQLIVSTILILMKTGGYWTFLFYILFYIFFIGGRVNLDLSDSKRLLHTRDRRS